MDTSSQTGVEILMWNSLAREAAKRIGGTIVANKIAGAEEPNGPEVYADRIKRDFHLHDYADAWALYDSDRAYWENYYRSLPRGPANNEFVRDSAAAAGVPSRNNVFEYGFPENNSVEPSKAEAPPLSIPGSRAWNNVFVRDSAAAAGIPSRNNVFEYGFPGSSLLQAPAGESRPPRANISPRSSLPIPLVPLASQRAPRGLPALLAELDAFDPTIAEVAPGGGLPGLIRESLRNR
jgi:hypothetical protein